LLWTEERAERVFIRKAEKITQKNRYFLKGEDIVDVSRALVQQVILIQFQGKSDNLCSRNLGIESLQERPNRYSQKKLRKIKRVSLSKNKIKIFHTGTSFGGM